MLQNQIFDDLKGAISRLQSSGRWPQFSVPQIRLDIPEQDVHGDFSTNIAMQLAGKLRKSPLEIANDLKEELKLSYKQVQIVHPGFLNFFATNEQLSEAVQEIVDAGDSYGRSTIGKGKKVLFEFISANPTGPLTLPNGRGGYLGDALANVYAELGYATMREYYINDRGNQIDILGESVARRYLQRMGINVPYPEELYQGEYINDLAEKLELKDYKLTDLKKIQWVKDRIKQKALNLMLDEIKRVVEEKMQIKYDSWFSEKAMYDRGLAEFAVEKLKEKNVVYEQDGALWLKTTQFGDDKDRVLVKSSGEGAYMQGDVALYYYRAFERKLDKVVLILGADHHGYEKRLKALPQIYEAKTVFDLIFIQLATLLRGGKEVRMSKRKGTFVTIEELIDEVGNDVARFFFLMYSSDRHMNFDLDLAKEQSDKNPVYYVQYAHARISSILREAEKAKGGTAAKVAVAEPSERALAKTLIVYPKLLEEIATNYEAHHLTTYALSIARAFHHFYGQCRVIENGVVNAERLELVRATQLLLRKTLGLIGVSAPEKM